VQKNPNSQTYSLQQTFSKDNILKVMKRIDPMETIIMESGRLTRNRVSLVDIMQVVEEDHLDKEIGIY